MRIPVPTQNVEMYPMEIFLPRAVKKKTAMPPAMIKNTDTSGSYVRSEIHPANNATGKRIGHRDDLSDARKTNSAKKKAVCATVFVQVPAMTDWSASGWSANKAAAAALTGTEPNSSHPMRDTSATFTR